MLNTLCDITLGGGCVHGDTSFHHDTKGGGGGGGGKGKKR